MEFKVRKQAPAAEPEPVVEFWLQQEHEKIVVYAQVADSPASYALAKITASGVYRYGGLWKARLGIAIDPGGYVADTTP